MNCIRFENEIGIKNKISHLFENIAQKLSFLKYVYRIKVLADAFIEFKIKILRDKIFLITQ